MYEKKRRTRGDSMADPTAPETEEPKKRSGKGLLIAAVLSLVLGVGAFFVTYTGVVQGLLGLGAADHATAHDGLIDPDVGFVAVEPIAISYAGPPARQFRIALQLEVPHDSEKEVQKLMPRVLNVLNGFLRAVDPDSLSDRAAWYDLRLKMLYRVRMVLGESLVRDLLITEFVMHAG